MYISQFIGDLFLALSFALGTLNLDEALQGDDKELMNRYQYVGISRATSHLAATGQIEK